MLGAWDDCSGPPTFFISVLTVRTKPEAFRMSDKKGKWSPPKEKTRLCFLNKVGERGTVLRHLPQ